MEHPINKPTDATGNELTLCVTALIVVLALVFASYFTLRAAVAELPVHLPLVEMPRS